MTSWNKDVDKQSFWKELPWCEAWSPGTYCLSAGKLSNPSCLCTPVHQFSYAGGNHWHGRQDTFSHHGCFSQWAWLKLQLLSEWVFVIVKRCIDLCPHQFLQIIVVGMSGKGWRRKSRISCRLDLSLGSSRYLISCLIYPGVLGSGWFCGFSVLLRVILLLLFTQSSESWVFVRPKFSAEQIQSIGLVWVPWGSIYMCAV